MACCARRACCATPRMSPGSTRRRAASTATGTASGSSTWLVRCAELEVLAPVPLGTTLLSRTAVVGQRRVWARRRGEFLLPDGTLAGWVHTDWVMIDGRGGLTRIPAIFAEEFRIPEATGQIGRVALPPTPAGTPTRRFAVRPHELDPMDHVNNAVYLDWLEEAFLAAGAGPDRARRRSRGATASSTRRRRTRGRCSRTRPGATTTAPGRIASPGSRGGPVPGGARSRR